MRHWFDGLAMFHRFTLGDGRVSYGSRFLESRSYRAARAQDRIVFGEFATDPCRSLFQRVQSLFSPGGSLPDNANVNVARLGERFIAMTETQLPVQFDPRTLEAADVRPYEAPGQLEHRPTRTWIAPLAACSTMPPSCRRAAATASSRRARGSAPRLIGSFPSGSPPTCTPSG